MIHLYILYIYIYIYMCVCVCVCVCLTDLLQCDNVTFVWVHLRSSKFLPQVSDHLQILQNVHIFSRQNTLKHKPIHDSLHHIELPQLPKLAFPSFHIMFTLWQCCSMGCQDMWYYSQVRFLALIQHCLEDWHGVDKPGSNWATLITSCSLFLLLFGPFPVHSVTMEIVIGLVFGTFLITFSSDLCQLVQSHSSVMMLNMILVS